eukprot:scaffold5873_cov172-Amphora_coffeaeformis.AAC.2
MKSGSKVLEGLEARFCGCKAQTIVITGASSGIGLEAAKLLVRINPGHRLVLVCRTDRSSKNAAKAVFEGLTSREQQTATIIPMPCDHTSLDSVRSFVKRLRRVLEETYDSTLWESSGIDVLCLNAAVLKAKDSPAVFTEDGLEMTFQTNALSPFLIAYMTEDLMNLGGRIVVSTSGLYAHTKLHLDGMIDRETKRAKKGFEMIDGSKFHFKRSYALSKVCNVALTLSLHKRLATRGVGVNCFSPGLMMTSGLFRHQTEEDLANSLSHSKCVRKNEKSVSWGGGALVYMALSEDVSRQSGMYWGDTDSRKGNSAIYGVDFCPCQIFEESVSSECAEELWQLCCQLTDVPHSILN